MDLKNGRSQGGSPPKKRLTDADNRMTQNGGSQLMYDDDGDLIKTIEGTAIQEFGYDEKKQIISYSSSNLSAGGGDLETQNDKLFFFLENIAG